MQVSTDPGQAQTAGSSKVRLALEDLLKSGGNRAQGVHVVHLDTPEADTRGNLSCKVGNGSPRNTAQVQGSCRQRSPPHKLDNIGSNVITVGIAANLLPIPMDRQRPPSQGLLNKGREDHSTLRVLAGPNHVEKAQVNRAQTGWPEMGRGIKQALYREFGSSIGPAPPPTESSQW